MEKMKFRIKDAEQSIRLQQVLFKLGYKWSNGTVTRDTDKPYIYTCFWKIGDICHSTDFSYKVYEEKDTESFIAEHTPEFDIDAPIELQYTRDGRKVLEIVKLQTPVNGEYQDTLLWIYKDGNKSHATFGQESGVSWPDRKNGLDIVTRKPEVTQTVTIQGVEIAVTLNPNDKTVSVKLKN